MVDYHVEGSDIAVDASGIVGYQIGDSNIVGYDHRNDMFFLENGKRATPREVHAGRICKTPCKCSVPALGKYATCWLGDCTIVALTARVAVVNTTCSTYSISTSLLRPMKATQTITGLRVLYGNDRCLVCPSLTFTGGASALLDRILEMLHTAGVTVHGTAWLFEQQAVGKNVAIALRNVSVHHHMLLQLRADTTGTVVPCDGFHDTTASIALAHVTVEEYLNGNPWALPISHRLLCSRLGVPLPLHPSLIFGNFMSYEDHLHLQAPQRPIAHPVFIVESDTLVHGVRSGTVLAQRDGTYCMAYAHGSYGEVRERGTKLSDLMWQLDDLYESCMPFGTYQVGMPDCPTVLLEERFGSDVYDEVSRTVTIML